MELRNLGPSGLRVSLIGLGCNNFGERLSLDETGAIVAKALDCGITFFDTADRYGGEGRSELQLGQALGPRRKDIVLATKFGWDLTRRGVIAGGSRRHIVSAVEGSLRRLNTDWIDLYQMHTPDPNTPIEETLRALEDLIRDGKVRYIGVSNFSAWRVVDALWTSHMMQANRVVSVQDEYSLAYRGHETALLPAVRAYNLGFIPYRPLASGVLTGKYRRDQAANDDTKTGHMKSRAPKYLSDRNYDLVEHLRAFADSSGHSMLTIALAWLAAQPNVSSIITGVRNPDQIQLNVSATDIHLSTEDLQELDRITTRM
jgi:aryl-alcohol dehydrogenase-like predicted oxidoreductase